jgi:hypothetical protein
MTSLAALLIRLVLDFVILIALVFALGRSVSRPQYRKLLVACLCVVAAFGLYHLLLLVPRWLLEWLLLVPRLIATGAILMAFGRLKLKQAALASVIVLVLHVILGWIL